MNTKKSVIFLSIGVLFIAITLVATISAWLTDQDQTAPTTFTVGDIEYELNSYSFNTTNVVPGDNLISTPLIITNKSNIVSQLRVKLEITTSVAGSYTVENIFTRENQSAFALDTNWVSNEDGYYYYKGKEQIPGNSIPAKTDTSADNINVLSYLSLNGSIVGNNFSNQTITLTITFQAKQYNHVTWETLGSQSINFSTGLSS